VTRRSTKAKPSPASAPIPKAAPNITPASSELTTTGANLAIAQPAAVSSTGLMPPVSNAFALLRSPERLREAIILNEILKPPLAIRGRARRR
jgi:hypothetical protein